MNMMTHKDIVKMLHKYSAEIFYCLKRSPGWTKIYANEEILTLIKHIIGRTYPGYDQIVLQGQMMCPHLVEHHRLRQMD